MDSDIEDDILEDDSLIAQNDNRDEELNDDLLCSDEEDLTAGCLEDSALPATDLPSPCGPGEPSENLGLLPNERTLALAECVLADRGMWSHVEYEDEDGAARLSLKPRTCAGEDQTAEEPDPGEVLDIQINGDEFQTRPGHRLPGPHQSRAPCPLEEHGGRPSPMPGGSAAEPPSPSLSPQPWSRAASLHQDLMELLLGVHGDIRSDSPFTDFKSHARALSSFTAEVAVTVFEEAVSPLCAKPLRLQTGLAGIHMGQHMFGQYHPASQPDRRPSVARPAPMGGAQPPAQPGGLSAPRTAPQGPLGLPGLGQTRAKFLCPPREASRSMTSSAPQAQGPSALLKPQQCVNQRLLLVPLPQTPPLLQCPSECNEPPSSSVSATPPVRQHSQSAQSQCTPQSQPVPLCTAIIRPRMQVRRLPNCSSGSSDASVLAGTEPVANSACPTPTPTVQVRPMARAVATGMPTTAKQPSSARAAACARAVPEPVLVGRRQGQEVKEEPTSPPSPLSIIAKTGRGSERQVGEEGDDGASWYRLQLEEQRHQRQRHLRQKEQKHILLVRDRWRRQPRRDLPLGSAREQQPRWGKGPSPQSIPQLQPGPCKPTQLDRQVFLSLSEYRPYPDPKGHPHLQPSRLQRHRRRFAFRPTSRPLFQPVAPPGALAQPELSGLHSALAVGPLAVHSSQDGRVAIAVTVRRVLPGPWQGQRHAQEPAGASGHFQGRQGERRPLLMRVVRQLPPKKQELQHDGVEGEDEERASVRLASLVIQGSRVVFEAKPRVVTFTPPALPTPSRTFTLGQGCPDPRR